MTHKLNTGMLVGRVSVFLPRGARTANRGIAIVSVCLSASCNVGDPWSYRLE